MIPYYKEELVHSDRNGDPELEDIFWYYRFSEYVFIYSEAREHFVSIEKASKYDLTNGKK